MFRGVESKRGPVLASRPFGAVDRGFVPVAAGVVSYFSFALVERVGGDGRLGGRDCLDGCCHVFRDFFDTQGAAIDADLVDMAVEVVVKHFGPAESVAGLLPP